MMSLLVPSRSALVTATTPVQYLRPEEVRRMVDAAGQLPRHRERNQLLIQVLFSTGLRISEALALTPRSLGLIGGLPILAVVGKGRKRRRVACPEELIHRLRSYAYTHQITDPDARFFPIARNTAWRIVQQVGERAGLGKRVWPHLLRHSYAIEALRQTGNTKALQIHLGHASLPMTMRYLSTLTEEDAVQIMGQVRV